MNFASNQMPIHLFSPKIALNNNQGHFFVQSIFTYKIKPTKMKGFLSFWYGGKYLPK